MNLSSPSECDFDVSGSFLLSFRLVSCARAHATSEYRSRNPIYSSFAERTLRPRYLSFVQLKRPLFSRPLLARSVFYPAERSPFWPRRADARSAPIRKGDYCPRGFSPVETRLPPFFFLSFSLYFFVPLLFRFPPLIATPRDHNPCSSDARYRQSVRLPAKPGLIAT